MGFNYLLGSISANTSIPDEIEKCVHDQIIQTSIPDILYINTVSFGVNMKIIMVRMRKLGVDVPRRMLSDRYTVVSRGMLTIMDVTDQGLRRPVKVVRLRQTAGHIYELIDPHILWASDGRFTLTGFERVRNDIGEAVDYAQSWLCTIDTDLYEVVDSEIPTYREKHSR